MIAFRAKLILWNCLLAVTTGGIYFKLDMGFFVRNAHNFASCVLIMNINADVIGDDYM